MPGKSAEELVSGGFTGSNLFYTIGCRALNCSTVLAAFAEKDAVALKDKQDKQEKKALQQANRLTRVAVIRSSGHPPGLWSGEDLKIMLRHKMPTGSNTFTNKEQRLAQWEKIEDDESDVDEELLLIAPAPSYRAPAAIAAAAPLALGAPPVAGLN